MPQIITPVPLGAYIPLGRCLKPQLVLNCPYILMREMGGCYLCAVWFPGGIPISGESMRGRGWGRGVMRCLATYNQVLVKLANYLIILRIFPHSVLGLWSTVDDQN